ncbi:MAG: PhzF family phenazine biosynthesis isomerase [Sphingobacteriales bacterium]|nr:MAG: PhzF family phenazine biosynthesis isomerase [Sphingobacteriales bacterium]
MKIFFTDSFTNEPFKGNPAAVCLPEERLSETEMQQIATEIGFSETAFVMTTDSINTYNIRYFSPKQEIPLCGHATLASAKILFGLCAAADILFVTAEGIRLPVRKEEGEIVMDFPVYETEALDIPQAMLSALGIRQAAATSYCPEKQSILIEIDSASQLAKLDPDFTALVASYSNIEGVLVTAPSDSNSFDFHYRYFWPWAGSNEDPATGAVQTFLAKYWSKKLRKQTLKAFQSSKRTGEMRVELRAGRVLIYGEAVVVLEGAFKH